MPNPIQLSLSNFRAFAETGPINIKPLTILVGENSTGKTSFLAALRFSFNLAEQSKSGYFNNYPFDLGSFEDIVHQESNVSGARFSVAIEKDVDIGKDASVIVDPRAPSDMRRCKLKVFFRSRFGDVALAGFEFSFGETEIEYKSGSKGGFRITKAGSAVDIPPRQSGLGFVDPQEPRFEDLRQLSYRLYNLLYNVGADNSAAARARSTSYRRIAQAFDAFLSGSYEVYSSPPVRSVPRRVYTSSDESGPTDQSHAPHELNRLKRGDRRRWSRLNAGLTQFGKLSGLFTRFDIAKLTRQDAGPFQLKVTVRGRAANIADVGYGVAASQKIAVTVH